MRRVSSAVMFGLGLAFLGISISAQTVGGNAEAKKLKNPVPMSAASIAAGKTAYTRNCRFCHGDEAKGNGTMAPKDTHPPDLTDAKWDRGDSDGEIFAVLRDGTMPDLKMKGLKGRMTETDMWNVVNFLRSVGPKK